MDVPCGLGIALVLAVMVGAAAMGQSPAGSQDCPRDAPDGQGPGGIASMKRTQAQHGVVCRLADEAHGYFGWPSVARTPDGALLVVASGPRLAHTCPFGKVSIMQSADDGRTWSAPRVISDTPLDDRDAGIVCLGGRGLLVSSFTVDTRVSLERHLKSWPADQRARATQVVASWTDQLMRDWLTPYVLLSDDAGATWSGPIRIPVSSPHGPILLRDGSLLYWAGRR